MTDLVVIMGVSGCGKSSVGKMLGREFGFKFIDWDDLHPSSNVAKMSRGVPLDDADRAPWLASVGNVLAGAKERTAIACSALKRSYRDIVRAQAGNAVFLHLHASQAVLAKRVNARKGHFMPPSLLDSQSDALEMLEEDEAGIMVNIDQPIDAVFAETMTYFRETAR
ncbi:MAG: gluconokinase [Pseudomonadota bacterium]